MESNFASVARGVLDWARRSDYSGHDPHDLLSAPILRGLSHPLARLIALQLGRRSPIDLRGILRVPLAENPKALALFLSGILRAKERVSEDWSRDSQQLASRLVRAMKQGAWGYPFGWQSRTHYLSAFSPNIVTTAFAGMSLIEATKVTGSEAYNDALQQAANFIVTRIPRYEHGGLAFGYAENDPQVVFNASLLGAEFLAGAGELLRNEEYIDLAKQAADFVLAHHEADGSWKYGLESSQSWVDSFHTGFVILSLHRIGRIVGNDAFIRAAERGFSYYRKTFIEPDFAVSYFPRKRYPIDAHALGQAMITLSTFGDFDAARNVAHWSVEHMLSPRGYFYYQRHRLFTNRIAYMRWSNAWMFRGLSEIVAHE